MLDAVIAAQRDEAQLAQLPFGVIANLHLGGAAWRDPAPIVGEAGIDQVADHAALAELVDAAANVGEPAGVGEGADQHAAERVVGATPQVMSGRLVDAFLVDEALAAAAVVAVGLAHEDARHGQPQEAGVLVAAQLPPARVLALLEYRVRITQTR